ncbi:MAG: nuclear transport factor 2 family protein [Solirubrobacterales bacterium]|nr:nuclear transport factor 2 family protein [Solirubrobacterales bacterium]
MNAVERLWQALTAGDLHRAAIELHDHVAVERPHAGERLTGADAFLAPYAQQPVEVLRVVTQGRHVASDARVGAWAVAAFFTIHDGRVLHAVEYWVELA